MRSFTLVLFALLLGTASKAQTIATFDTLSLPKPDTFYVNYSAYGTDVGFDDGLAHFPCVYDTFPGGFQYWNYGFAYSNMTDSITQGFGNQYSAITGKGYNNSAQYLVAYGASNKVFLKGKAINQPVNGFYIANTAYAWHSMANGDMFAKKFGGPTGSDSDWFKVTIRGYSGGSLKNDSVEYFLADFRSPVNANDTIMRGWNWVNLLPLGDVDSLLFTLNSSDTGMFGMNTPAYFAMDNFHTFETASVGEAPAQLAAKLYPNPAVNELFVETKRGEINAAYVIDMTGKVVSQHAVKDELTLIPVSSLAPGTYILKLAGDGGTASARFEKH